MYERTPSFILPAGAWTRPVPERSWNGKATGRPHLARPFILVADRRYTDIPENNYFHSPTSPANHLIKNSCFHALMRQPASSLDLFTDSVRLMGDATLISVMEFDRRLAVERMEAALSRCLDAYPILSSRLVRDGGPAYWEFMGRKDGDDDVDIVEIGNEDLRPFVTGPMDPHRGRQAKVRLLRSSDRDTVVINLAHAAADGHGLQVLSRALLEAYVKPLSVPSADGTLPERDTLWTAELLDDDNDIPDGLEVIDPMWPSPCGPSKAPSTFHRAHIPAEGIESIRNLAHAHGGTINDVLMAAYFLSMSDRTGHYGPLKVFFPVDLRRYLPDGSREMTNQAANVSIPLTRAKGEGMPELLRKIIDQTARLKKRRIGIREQVAFDRGCDPAGITVKRMVEEMASEQARGWADIFISNPGRFELPTVPGLQDAYICYPGGYMPTTCFVISTFRGTMSVSMGYQDDEGPREATRRALAGFVGHLPVDHTQVIPF